MQVVALIHEEDSRYGVSFPDFPGATTVAATPDAAIAKAAEVLAFHVEGLVEDGALPEPRTLAQLRADPAFIEDAEGAMIALVPYAPPSRAVRVNVTLEESLLERIDRAAEAEGESRSGYLAQAAKVRLGMMVPTQARPVPSGIEDIPQRIVERPDVIQGSMRAGQHAKGRPLAQRLGAKGPKARIARHGKTGRISSKKR